VIRVSSENKSQSCSISGEHLWEWWQWACQCIPETEKAAGRAELKTFLLAFSELTPLDLTLHSYRSQPSLPLRLPLAELSYRWQQRWQQRVPLQYLLGCAYWRDLELTVTPSVLIPRPETEELLEWVDRWVPVHQQQGHWLDLGTGSGAIALGLARLWPQVQLHAVDRSAAALAVAKINIQRYRLGDRIHCHQGSWFEPIAPLKGQVQGIISNPPYIPTAMIARLQPEVQYHEPHLALDGGSDGLAAVRLLVQAAPAYLLPQGWLFIELMAGQGKSARAIATATGAYQQVHICPDINRVDRFLVAQCH
jgi:release factor glutamine methyltransferase